MALDDVTYIYTHTVWSCGSYGNGEEESLASIVTRSRLQSIGQADILNTITDTGFMS